MKTRSELIPEMDTTEQSTPTTRRGRGGKKGRPAKKVAAGDAAPEEEQSETELDTSNTDAQVVHDAEEKMEEDAAPEENAEGEKETESAPTESEPIKEGETEKKTEEGDESSNKKESEVPPKPEEPPANPIETLLLTFTEAQTDAGVKKILQARGFTLDKINLNEKQLSAEVTKIEEFKGRTFHPYGRNDRGRMNKNQRNPRNQRKGGNMKKRNDPRGMRGGWGGPPRGMPPPRGGGRLRGRPMPPFPGFRGGGGGGGGGGFRRGGGGGGFGGDPYGWGFPGRRFR